MADTEKRKPGRPPKIVQTAQDPDDAKQVRDGELAVPGVTFKWVNRQQRDKQSDWGIWRLVDGESELGEEIARQLGPHRVETMAYNNLFHKGDLTLAYTSTDEYDQFMADRKERNAEKMRMIDAAELRRNVIIPAASGFGKK